MANLFRQWKVCTVSDLRFVRSCGLALLFSAWATGFNGLEGLVNAAILAANAHNAQPWLIPEDEIQRNGPDREAKKSVGVKWFKPDYTDYTKSTD